MPPVQPQNSYQPPAPEHDPSRYEFIMSPGQQQRPSLIGGGWNPRKLAIIGGGIVGVIILFAIIGSLLSGGKGDTLTLKSIAAQQAEIVRVSDLGLKNVSSQDTNNFATNTNLCLSSSQQQLLSYLGQNGVKINEKQLALKANPKTDAALQAASESGTFDATFTTTLQTELTAYQASLQAAYKTATGKTEKQVLSDAFAQAGLLLKQSQQHS
jgi:hypothetical protein